MPSFLSYDLPSPFRSSLFLLLIVLLPSLSLRLLLLLAFFLFFWESDPVPSIIPACPRAFVSRSVSAAAVHPVPDRLLTELKTFRDDYPLTLSYRLPDCSDTKYFAWLGDALFALDLRFLIGSLTPPGAFPGGHLFQRFSNNNWMSSYYLRRHPLMADHPINYMSSHSISTLFEASYFNSQVFRFDVLSQLRFEISQLVDSSWLRSLEYKPLSAQPPLLRLDRLTTASLPPKELSKVVRASSRAEQVL